MPPISWEEIGHGNRRNLERKSSKLMTPLPKRKHSKGRRNRRRAHYNLKPTTLEMCGQCKELKLPHRVCPTCGTYNGRQVVDVAARDERKTRKNAQ
jgi:large subunit ribosomal protein L32